MMATASHRPQHIHNGGGGYHRHGRRPPQYLLELSQCLLDFVVQLLPTKEEISVKEDVRKLLERLIKTIEPTAQLLSFGSTANGFELKNSDMDLCCLLDNPSDPLLSASQFVLRAAQLLERETKFFVKPLPNARIPIIKLSLQPSPSIPFGIACDIGFENRLALENTRLLFTYAAIDPTRVRTLVLFLKLWSKRRKINSPYHGTLSSYGYALLVIFFLVHVKTPPVLPNLQQMPPMRPISPSETEINGRNVWFFDDIELLRRRWQSPNTETIGELLLDFFRFYSRDFNYATSVVSIRAGQLAKDMMESNHNDPREGTSLWIEDPFEINFNVGRCVTKDGLYTIRGEFMRGIRILSAKHELPMTSLAMLCEEREDEIPRGVSQSQRAPQHRYNTGSPRSHSVGGSPIAPRLGLSGLSGANLSQECFTPQFAPSTPITITSPADIPKPSPPSRENSDPQSSSQFVPAVLPSTMAPPPHMAPQRGKWTSPPPDHAPPQRHNSFNERLATGIQMAVNHPQFERHHPPTRSSTGSSATEDDIEEVLDTTSFGTQSRSSSPVSSASFGLSIPEFKSKGRPPIPDFESRGRPPIRIQESPEEDSASTPKPIHDTTIKNNNRNPHWRHSYQPPLQEFKFQSQSQPQTQTQTKAQPQHQAQPQSQPIPPHNHPSLPSLTIPQSMPSMNSMHSMPFFSPNQYSPSAPHWTVDANTPGHYSARMNNFNSSGNGHPQGRMRGNSNARYGNKQKYSPSPSTPTGMVTGRSRPPSFILPNNLPNLPNIADLPNLPNLSNLSNIPNLSNLSTLPNAQTLGVAMTMSSPHQLPTPPVSSPCSQSHTHLTPSPPTQPALRLEDLASTSAR